MEIIRHRVNRVADLDRLDPRWGAEFDVRSRAGRLILAHDPHRPGDDLEDYLRAWRRAGRAATLVFNPKEDGLETDIARLAERHGVRRYFLLDLPMPTLVRLAVRERRKGTAVRVSEYESARSALRLSGRARWAWLSCFDGRPPGRASLERLKRHFRLCLASPEIEGHPVESVRTFRRLAPLLDAVCTDRPDLWLA